MKPNTVALQFHSNMNKLLFLNLHYTLHCECPIESNYRTIRRGGISEIIVLL